MKISLILIYLVLASCTVDSVKNEFRIFEKYKNNNKYESALKSLNKIISVSKDKKIVREAYLEMAELNLENIKSPESAILVYQKLAQLSDKLNERNEYKYLVSKIHLEYLNDYDSAIREAKAIDLTENDIELAVKVKKILINSYKNKKNYYQALIELNNLFKLVKPKSDDYFELSIIKANILFLEGKHKESNIIYNDLVKNFPSRSIDEKVFLQILANYEAMGLYGKAIELLSASRSKHSEHSKFIESKLNRLKDLKKNMPGAGGLRR